MRARVLVRVRASRARGGWVLLQASLEFDDSGATRSMSAERQKMMVVNFFMTRVAIQMVLRPWESNIGGKLLFCGRR